MKFADRSASAWLLAGLAFLLAAAGALPYAGGYNDGSRLATTESLIDRGTLAIDDSLFAKPSVDRPLYPRDSTEVLTTGTLDKVFVNGHYYSDKPAVLAVLNAAVYRALMIAGLPRPDARPDIFCRVSAMITSGLAYAAAVGFMWLLGGAVGLSPGWRLVWLAGFALATVLPAYTRQVNPSLPQAAAVAGLSVFLSRIAAATGGTPWRALAFAGCCAGFGYTLDGGTGPLLLAASAAAVVIRVRRVDAVSLFLVCALPWVAAHHILVFAVGRVWVPLGMIPEFLKWPGSPFVPSNLTGVVRHSWTDVPAYSYALLAGKNGLLVCNLPLMLAAAFGWAILARPGRARLELSALLTWCLAGAALYVGLSDNGGGAALSIRWFVPFLVPGFWLLARLLVDRPAFRADFVILTTGGLILASRMWSLGPWPYQRAFDPRAIAVSSLVLWLAARGVSYARKGE